MVITTILIFIVILGILVFVHEFGHFIMAKRAGVKVEEFGFGFPPRIFGVKRGETIYSINAIPLGGFVQLVGEQGEEKNDPRSLASKSILTRTIIFASGVAMNFIFAIVFLSAAHITGLPTTIADDESTGYSDIKVQISMVTEKSPAELAGLKMGDVILELRSGDYSITPKTVKDVQNFNSTYAGTEITLKIKRGTEILENIKATPRPNPMPAEGYLGVSLARTAKITSWFQAIIVSIFSALYMVYYIITELGKVVMSIFGAGSTAGMELTGPIGIAVLTGQMAQLGFIYLLQFTAILSINLAVINALPLPALDGGKIFFLLIEKIKGMPVSQKFENAVHTAGFAALLLLLLAVTIKDIARLGFFNRIMDLFT